LGGGWLDWITAVVAVVSSSVGLGRTSAGGLDGLGVAVCVSVGLAFGDDVGLGVGVTALATSAMVKLTKTRETVWVIFMGRILSRG
jgi:hypothetical protein